MEISVIRIGNSKGIRLSKALLERYNITDAVELILEQHYIIIRPTKMPRKDWDKSFKRMRKKGDDALLIPDFFNDEDIA